MGKRFNSPWRINAHSVIPGEPGNCCAVRRGGVRWPLAAILTPVPEIGHLGLQKGLVLQAGLSLEQIPFWYPPRLR